jgi:DNA repair protein RadD
MQLRYYQKEAVDCVQDGHNGILVLPTGTGKSLIVAGLAQKYPDKKILVLQPSKEILEQNYSKILAVAPPGEVGIYSASLGRKDIKRITLATIGSIKSYETFDDFRIMIIDECHLVNAQGGRYEKLIRYNRPRILVGLTATPYRMHSTSFGLSWRFLHRTRPKIFDSISYVYQNQKAFDDGYLIKPTYHEYDYDTSTLSISGSDYSERSILRLNHSIDLYNKLADIVRQSTRRHILIFTTSIEEAETISDKLSIAGIASSEVSSHNSKKERVDIIQKFRRGDLRVVVNVGILTTGFDFPELDCVIGARPTMSLGLYYQMLGRGVRPAPGKDSWDYHDLCGNVKAFGKVDDYVIDGRGAQTSLESAGTTLIEGYNKTKTYTGGNWVVPFGKYKGLCIAYVDAGYLQWCLSELDGFRYKKQFEMELMRRTEISD